MTRNKVKSHNKNMVNFTMLHNELRMMDFSYFSATTTKKEKKKSHKRKKINK